MMDPPDQALQVQQAFRLGWALAELRGRYRPSPPDWVPDPHLPPRVDEALPLGDERKPTEQLIEVHGVIENISEALALDFDDRHQQRTFSETLQVDGKQQNENPTAKGWRSLATTLYHWDAKIQDDLATRPVLSAAYQLGRGLAETYWMLDPTAKDGGWNSWTFLLGERRCARLQLLLARISAYIDPLTPAAVRASLEVWAQIASEPLLRADETTPKALYRQGLLWRDLIRGEQRPTDLVRSNRVIGSAGLLWTVATRFWIQIILGVASAIAFAIAGAALVTGEATQKSTVALILGGFGVTAASLYARAKAIANSLVDEIRRTFEEDRVGMAATIRPPRPLKALATGAEFKRIASARIGRPT